MLNLMIGAGILICAILAIRENRLLISALWLALTSAMVSWFLYRLGAAEVAAVELSVGAGLVTVLFVFAINIAGDEAIPPQALLPRPLAWMTVAVLGLLMAWMILPAVRGGLLEAVAGQSGGSLSAFQKVLWQERTLDVLMQVVLLFSGALAVVGLLGEHGPSLGMEDPS